MNVLAFYLPQFHPIPENDGWWGKGFTEWTNVTKSQPVFKGHYQPHLPADLGFYDLRLPEIQHQQADLARNYGVDGFIYYHYWFDGKRLLHKPIDALLTDDAPDFPYCLCWANENWTRRWDGKDTELLIGQPHSLEDDRTHIEFLLQFFERDNYIKIDDKPVLCVYRTELMTEPGRTADLWKEAVAKAGFKGLYLIKIENAGPRLNPEKINFDAAIEFAPDFHRRPMKLYHGKRFEWMNKFGLIEDGYFNHRVYEYQHMIDKMMQKKWPEYTWFRGATPSWDNSARRQVNASIYINNTPEKFQAWLETIMTQTQEKHQPDKQMIVINAWNEWAEGCHLEPDQKFGHAWLNAVKQAKQKVNG